MVKTPSGGDAQGDDGGQGHTGEPTACAEACGRRRPRGFQAVQRGKWPEQSREGGVKWEEMLKGREEAGPAALSFC